MATWMLWHKAWRDTRWTFVLGVALLMLMACGAILAYPRTLQVIARVGSAEAVDAIAGGNAAVREQLSRTVELSRTYRGFVWATLFHNELPQFWCLFAILLGTGGLVPQSVRRGAMFTLSLPVSRQQIVFARAGTTLAELLLMALLPALVLPVLSPMVGEHYSLGEAVVHAVSLFVGGTVFFSLTFLLSSIFEQLWVPPLIMLGIAGLIAVARVVNPDLGRYTLAPVLTAESYFRGDGLPWTGLIACAIVSTGLLWLAARNVARRDF
jgi:hypothetical protein